MVEIAAEKGMTMTAEEVRGLLREMHGDDEFDDIELDSVAWHATHAQMALWWLIPDRLCR